MPALLTSMSMPPKARTTASTPSPTCRSSLTSIATPIATPPLQTISLGRRVRGFLLQVRDGHLGALACEKHRDVPANSAGGPGDNG